MLKVKDFLLMIGESVLPDFKIIYDFNDEEGSEKWIYTDLAETVEDFFGEWYLLSQDSIYIEEKKDSKILTFILYVQKDI